MEWEKDDVVAGVEEGTNGDRCSDFDDRIQKPTRGVTARLNGKDGSCPAKQLNASRRMDRIAGARCCEECSVVVRVGDREARCFDPYASDWAFLPLEQPPTPHLATRTWTHTVGRGSLARQPLPCQPATTLSPRYVSTTKTRAIDSIA